MAISQENIKISILEMNLKIFLDQTVNQCYAVASLFATYTAKYAMNK